MSRCGAILAAACLLLQGLSASAQDSAAGPALRQAVRSGWVRFEIVAGRVTLAELRVGNVNTSSRSADSNEQLSIQVDNGQPALKYEWAAHDEKLSADEKLSVQAMRGNSLHLLHAAGSNSKIVRVEFSQNPGEPVRLTLGTGAARQEFRAGSLWHLLISQPAECRQHLIPLLELLHPDWKLAKAGNEVERELLLAAAGAGALDRARWATLVEQIGDDNYATREAADRALRAASPAVLGYLQQLDFNRLDVEQQFRVRRIIKALSRQIAGDTPDQIAAWLSGDTAVWLALLSRSDESTRRAAAGQLTALLGQPLAFDPAAEPETRQRQIEQLRAQLQAKQPESKQPADPAAAERVTP